MLMKKKKKSHPHPLSFPSRSLVEKRRQGDFTEKEIKSQREKTKNKDFSKNNKGLFTFHNFLFLYLLFPFP